MARITIEDALREGHNRFALALLTIRRVKQLLKGSRPLCEKTGNREVVTALREVAGGKVRYAHPEYLVHFDSPDVREIQRDMEFSGYETDD